VRRAALAVRQQAHAFGRAANEKGKRKEHQHDDTGRERGRAPAERQHEERHEREDHHAPNGLSRLNHGHGESALPAKPVIDRGERGVVEAELEARGHGADEYDEEEEIAVSEGQQHESEPGEDGPEDQHHPDIEPVDEIPGDRPSQRRLELGEREGQGGGGATEVHLIEHRQEVEREPRVVGPALHRIEDAADDHDPPAVENTARAVR
jgi:hypothetical protein